MQVKPRSTTYRSETGKLLHRMEFRPAGEAVGGVMLVHGLGDHISRYDEVGGMLARRGLLVAGVDLPGHGISPGLRGNIGDWGAVESIFRETVGHLRAELGEEARLGMVAHSMGAFIGLYFAQRAPEIFEFAWLSSTLTKPGAHRHRGIHTLARMASKIVPWMPVDSGVRPEHCRQIQGPEDLDPLWHSRVSVEWGAELLKLEGKVREGLGRLNPDLKVLMTHGDDDVVCPPGYAREIFEAMELSEKEYMLFEGIMHEPFMGEHRRGEVIESAGAWLERIGFPEAGRARLEAGGSAEGS